MSTVEALKEQISSFRSQIAEIESKIQSLLPNGVSAKNVRFSELPYGFLEKNEYHKQLKGLKSELEWATKQASGERVAAAKNKILDFIRTKAWIDSKQLHAKIEPLLDQKLELLWKIQEFELSPSPGPVDNRGHGEDDLPRERQCDLGALEPPQAPDL